MDDNHIDRMDWILQCSFLPAAEVIFRYGNRHSKLI